MRFYLTYFKRYVSSYPTRMLLLLAGVTIAMVFIAFMGMMTDSVRSTNQEKRFADYGEFQGMAMGVRLQDVSAIEENPKVQDVGFSEVMGTIVAGYEKAYLGIMDSNAMQMSRLNMMEGKQPEEADEIAVEDVALQSLYPQAKIGDSIKLRVLPLEAGNSTAVERSFILSGIFENKPLRTLLEAGYLSGGSGIEHAFMPAFLVSGEGLELWANEGPVQKNMLFSLKDKSDTLNLIPRMQASMPIIMNALYAPVHDAQLNKSDATLETDNHILIALVALLAVIGIMQSFNITVQERERQLGVLKAVGAQRSQLRGIVLGEALLISILSVPLGIILSIALLKWTMQSIGDFSGQLQRIAIIPETIIVSALICVASVIGAALIPALRAQKLSPVKIIAGNSILSSGSGKRQGQLWKEQISKCGIAFYLAYHHLNRQKGRSCLIASVMMLTVFTSVFSYNYDKMLQLDQASLMDQDQTYSYRIRTVGAGSKVGKVLPENGMNAEQIDLLKSIDGVKSVNAYKQLNAAVVGFPLRERTEYYQDMDGAAMLVNDMNNTSSEWTRQQLQKLDDTLFPVNAKVIGLDEKSMAQWRPSGKKEMAGEAILYAPLPDDNYGKVDFEEVGLRQDDFISLVYYANTGKEDFEAAQVRLTSVVNTLPEGMKGEGIFGSDICLLVNENLFNELTNESLFNDIFVYTNPEYRFTEEVRSLDDEIGKIASSGRKLFVESRMTKILEFKQDSKTMMIRLYFTTGVFVTLSIFILLNVVLSSIFARKRELAMLRAVGITKAQMMWSVLLENAILAALAGIAGIGFMLLFIVIREAAVGKTGYSYSVSTQFPWLVSILILIATLVVSIFVSRYALRRNMRQGIIDAIRDVE